MDKASITPVLDHEGMVGVIIEWTPVRVEAYYIDGFHLLGVYSSKGEAAAELLLHAECSELPH